MEIVIALLLWVHLVSLAMGGVATFGIPVAGSRLKSATPETRPLLFAIVHGLSRIARIGLGLLLITGPLLFWLRWGWAAPNFWFWVKMILVAVLLGLVIFAGINTKRGEAGDRAAAMRGPMIGMATMVTFLAVILSAVLAFG